jgi:predicted nuclease of predicted toxin-antitoxin system
MNIVADESVDFSLVKSLRQAGYNVTAIIETTPGINDKQVLNIANNHNALLIAEDKDFGELTFRLRLNHCGILLIRLFDLPRNEKNRISF